MEEKRCSACGQPFGCGRSDERCWCVDLPALPASALRESTDCLCPRCLAERLAQAAPATPVQAN